jgi:hypothetical protein
MQSQDAVLGMSPQNEFQRCVMAPLRSLTASRCRYRLQPRERCVANTWRVRTSEWGIEKNKAEAQGGRGAHSHLPKKPRWQRFVAQLYANEGGCISTTTKVRDAYKTANRRPASLILAIPGKGWNVTAATRVPGVVWAVALCSLLCSI